jgi:hypothetical protein
MVFIGAKPPLPHISDPSFLRKCRDLGFLSCLRDVDMMLAVLAADEVAVF